MEFENQNSQAHSTPYFQNPYIFTPDQSQQFYTVPNNTMNPFINQFQQFQQPQFWNQGTNLIAQQNQFNLNPVFQQVPLQMNTQQFLQQPQDQNEEDQDQDYQPEEEESSSSSSSSEEQEQDLQEEEQFDDPDFDLQAYLKVRDQL